MKRLLLQHPRVDISESVDYLSSLKFVPVKTKYIKKGWSAVSLQGYGESISDIFKPNVLGSKTPSDTVVKTNIYDDPELESVRKILEAVPSDKERVRVMRLDSKCTINAHTDKVDKDFVNEKIVRIHVPLTYSDVIYSIWNKKEKESFSASPGQYYMIDVNKRHMVKNLGDDYRLNLVIDVFVNDEIRMILSQLEN